MASQGRKSRGGEGCPVDEYTAEELREALMCVLDGAGSAYKLRGDALTAELIPGVELVLRGTWCYIHLGGAPVVACEYRRFDDEYSKTLSSLISVVLVEAVGPDSDDLKFFTVSVDKNAGGLLPAATLDYKGLPVWNFSTSGLPAVERLRTEIGRTTKLADGLERGLDA